MERLAKKGVPIFRVSSIAAIAGIGLPMRVIARSASGMRMDTLVKRYADIAPVITRIARLSALESKRGAHMAFERCDTGHEVACGVIVLEKKPIALVPVDALPREGADPLPHHLTPQQVGRVQELALRAHKAAGAKTHSCVRCIVSGDEVYAVSLEASPAPDSASPFFISAALAGISRKELAEELGVIEGLENR